MKNRTIGALALVLLISVFVIAIPRENILHPQLEENSYFILSSWDYPDEHGQGIEGFRFYENSSGSWVAAPWYYVGGALDGLPFYYLHNYDPYSLNWSAGVAMKIRVYSLFNQTVVGVASTSDGQNYQRHTVIVSNATNVIFEKYNFTYYDVTEVGDENYYYEYEVILNFLPVAGVTYTVVLTYEIYM